MLLNLDQLEKQLDKDKFQGDRSMAAFCLINKQFQMFIDTQSTWDYDSQMIERYFAEYTGIEVNSLEKHYSYTWMQSRESKVVSSKALDASLVVTECSGTKSYKHDTSSSSRTYITHVVYADIRPVKDKEPMAECEDQVMIQENEKLNKENEHLKQTYKELYDSIKKTRIQTKDHNDSLIAQVNSKTVENADLKAQIQEKVFANVALKNELRKLKGNSVDTKFAKPSILGKPVLQPPRNQSVVRQPNAFKSERPNFSKPRFASQVDVNNILNSQEESYGSNDMAHNHYLEEARKKTQERNRNSKPSVMHTTSLQNTTNGSKPNPRSNNQISRSLPVSKSSLWNVKWCVASRSLRSLVLFLTQTFVCSTCHKCVFNANHDNCITKFLKEVNSRAKVQSPKTRNINKPVEPKSHTQKPGRQIAKGQRFSPKKSSAVHEKPNNSIDLVLGTTNLLGQASLFNDKWRLLATLQAPLLKEKKGLVQNSVSPTTYVPPSKRDYEILFQPLFDEYFNPPPCAVSPDPVAVAAPRPVDPAGSPLSTTIDQDVPSASTSPTNQEIQFQVTHQGVEEQIHGHQNAQFDNAPLLHNLPSDPSSEETTLQGVIPSNLHHLNQSFDTLTKLTKNHQLENVIGNPS
ncbi:hypothetical protein Tco_0773541 [Tanacetum coccineum]|uniref:Uncharacterized protein n=1 Tax=Tanacetum coccineum TaxID=301880 RepID=A0ABQ4ZLX2_9ASTR